MNKAGALKGSRISASQSRGKSAALETAWVQRVIYAKSMRWGGAARDHESGAAMSRLMATWRCRVRSAPWLRRAARPRHRQPCGFHRRAGHESGPKARHEKTRKNSFALQQLIAATDFVCFRVPRRWLSCLGALPEADRLARRNDAWRRPKAYKPVRRDTAHKTRSVVRQRAECSWSRVSAKHTYTPIYAYCAKAINLQVPYINRSVHPIQGQRR